MKKIALNFPTFIFALLLIFATSCSKDEDSSLNDISGVWNITSYQVNSQQMMGNMFTEATLKFDMSQEESFTFTKTDMSGSTETETGTYFFNQSIDVMTVTINGVEIEYDYTLKDDIMTLEGTDSSQNNYMFVASK